MSDKKSSTLFRIDSSLRSNGNISEFAYRSYEAVKFKKATLLSIEFPNTIYTVSESRGTNYIRVNQNGTLLDVYLTEGSYSAATFVSELQAQLNAAIGSNGAFTVVYDQFSAKITISNVVVIDLLFSSSGYINEVMGFESTDTGLFLTHISTSVINLGGPNYISFDINPFPAGPRVVTANGVSPLITIPLIAQFGTVNYFDALGIGYVLTYNSGQKNTLGNIKITVYDEKGRVPDLKLDWSMLLELE